MLVDSLADTLIYVGWIHRNHRRKAPVGLAGAIGGDEQGNLVYPAGGPAAAIESA